jgi:hypothetical protein
MSGFQNAEHYMSVFRNHGFDRLNRDATGKVPRVELGRFLRAGQEQLKSVRGEVNWKDAIATSDISPWLPQVIERNVLEAEEPLLVLTSLFERAAYEAGQVIEFPAVGAVIAADVAEGEAYPEIRVQESGATVTAKVGKSGIAFRMTEETISRSRYDIMGMHLRACAKGLARWKEVKAADILTTVGVTCFDNLSPTLSRYGTTTGRSMNGEANGSLTLDDLFDTFSQVMMQGFSPDTVILHPLTYIMFLKDEVLRAVTLAGGNQVWFGGWSGNPARTGPGSRTHVSGAQNIVPGGAASGDTASGVNEYNTQIDSRPDLPSRWPWPLKIVVSPWMPFDPETKMCDIIVADSSNLGLLIEEYPVRVDKWDDLATDITKVKLKESYCFHVLNEGYGVGVMKNVRVVPNMINLPAVASISASGELQELSRTTAISLS